MTPDKVIAEARSTDVLLTKAIHERSAKALLAVIAPLIGFAAMIAGGFSRFGLWRQIFLAFGLLIFVKSIDSAAVSAVRRAAENWPLLYSAILAGFCVAVLLLWYAANPNMWRKSLPKAAETSQ